MDCEFIVSDNSDGSGRISYGGNYVKVIRPPSVLNMTDHWNFILARASGRYLTFLGDDDLFVAPALANFVTFLKNCDDDFVTTWTASYRWPRGDDSGHFYFVEPAKHNKDSLSEIKKRVRKLDYSDLPIPYNKAVFHRRLLGRFADERKFGEFCSSRIPDVNAGAKIALLSESAAVFRAVVFISGASVTSNGQLSRSNPEHPRAKEFSDPKRNPVRAATGWLPQEAYPFGYATYFEGLNESLLQLGERHLVREAALTFRLIFHSSQPPRQAEIMGRHFGGQKLLRTLAMMLGVIREKVSPFLNFIAYVKLRLHCRIQGRAIVSYKGTCASSSSLLSIYLQDNSYLRSFSHD